VPLRPDFLFLQIENNFFNLQEKVIMAP